MITSQVIQNCIDDLKNITGCEFLVLDTQGITIAKNTNKYDAKLSDNIIQNFLESEADGQVIDGIRYMKVTDDSDPVYVLICGDTNEEYTIARIAISNLQRLMSAYRERFDRNSFLQNLILDNLLLVDIYNRAKKLHIEIKKRRVVLVLEMKAGKENYGLEILRNYFANEDYVTAVDERNLIVIKQLSEDADYEHIEEVAQTTVDMMNTEAMVNVRLAYGTIVQELKDVSKSYKEAKMALDVGKIFYAQKDIVAYNMLGIGRLIYQLPVNLCQMFIEEIFNGKGQQEFDEETLTTINMFLENNLNVSETARQLYVHRNTLLYRLEKLEKMTGLDIRIFDDALTLKIALMVNSYMKYLENKEY